MRFPSSPIQLGLVLLACLATSAAQAQWKTAVAKDDVVVPNFAAAEGRIAVVPPGTNNACKDGAIAFSTDLVRPAIVDAKETTGIVKVLDLNNAERPPSKVFAPKSQADQINYLSNDHNLVGFPDGRLLYQIATGTKAMPADHPWWFDQTFRESAGHFGPGARTGIMNFVSTDCGANFDFASVIDAYFEKDDPCGNPQPRGKDADGNALLNPPFDMGGTDGPWAGYDHAAKSLYTVQGCWGRTRGADVTVGGKTEPRLGSAGVSLSYVFSSTDGKNWKKFAQIDDVLWLKRVVGLADKRVLVSHQNGITVLTPKASKPMTAKRYTVASLVPGWKKKLNEGTAVINVNIATSAQLVRAPGESGLALYFMPANVAVNTPQCDKAATMPAQKACNNVNGFAVFRFDPTKTEPFIPLDPVVPLAADNSNNATGAIVHMTVSDSGQGPIMAHWTDVDMVTGQSVARGRVYMPNGKVTDVVLSRKDGTDRSFVLNNKSFLGDYKGGTAFNSPTPIAALSDGKTLFGPPTTTFVPMWVETDADGKRHVHFTRVHVRKDPFFLSAENLPALGKISIEKSVVTVHADRPLRTSARPMRALINQARSEIILDSEADAPANVVNPKYLQIIPRKK